MLKIAKCQLLVEGGEPDRNLQRAKACIEEAANEGSKIIVLPECIDFGWTHPSGLNESKPIPGEYSTFFCNLAKINKIFICVGLTEKSKPKNFNSAILISDEGKIIIHYQKINILEKAKSFYDCGSKLEVAKTKLGKIGLTVCSDNYFKSSVLAHSLSRMGAEIILSPGAWTIENDNLNDNPYENKWSKTMKKITKDYNNVFVAVTSVGYIVGGPFEGKKMIGRSISFMNGEKISELSNNETSSEIKYIEVEIKKSDTYGV